MFAGALCDLMLLHSCWTALMLDCHCHPSSCNAGLPLVKFFICQVHYQAPQGRATCVTCQARLATALYLCETFVIGLAVGELGSFWNTPASVCTGGEGTLVQDISSYLGHQLLGNHHQRYLLYFCTYAMCSLLAPQGRELWIPFLILPRLTSCAFFLFFFLSWR